MSHPGIPITIRLDGQERDSGPRVAPSRNRLCPCGSGSKFKLCCLKKAPAAEQRTPPVAQPLIAEINLEHAFLGCGADMTDYLAHSDAGERVVHIAAVLQEMDRAWSSGARTLLVSVDSAGGQAAAGFLLYDAIATWRRAGGKVVVFVSGLAASTLSWAILPADLIVARKQARLCIHGPSRGLSAAVTDAKRAIYRTWSLAQDDLIERWIQEPSDPSGRGVMKLDSRQAHQLGFVDFVGGRGIARDVASKLARGEQVDSPRKRALAERGALPEFAELLARLHVEMDALRRSIHVERAA